MHHTSSNQACLAVVVLILMVSFNIGECKSRGLTIRTSRGPSTPARGCAFYGHSCFGGHGKRSMPDLNLRPIPQVEIPMKFIQDPAHFELPANYDNAIDENSYSEESTEQQHDQDLKYAVYGLFRQWMNDLRKVRNADVKRSSATFELLKSASGGAGGRPSSVANAAMPMQ